MEMPSEANWSVIPGSNKDVALKIEKEEHHLIRAFAFKRRKGKKSCEKQLVLSKQGKGWRQRRALDWHCQDYKKLTGKCSEQQGAALGFWERQPYILQQDKDCMGYLFKRTEFLGKRWPTFFLRAGGGEVFILYFDRGPVALHSTEKRSSCSRTESWWTGGDVCLHWKAGCKTTEIKTVSNLYFICSFVCLSVFYL